MLSEAVIRQLKALVGAENVLTSEEDRWVYSYDATALLRQVPDAVVVPQSVEQMAAVVRLANEAGFGIVPRGAGTGLSGGSVPVENCVVLLTHRLGRILEIDTQNLTALVEPGVITADLHAAVEAKGLFYPPDPGSMKVCTLGGNVAENAGGLRGLKYGVTKDYVVGLEVVLPTGEVLWTGGKNAKDVAGYNLRQLFVGSEGTLGIFTKILVKLIPKPMAKRTMLAYFPRMSQAAETVSAIIAAFIIPVTLEFLDQTTIRCVEEYARMGLPTDMEAILLMETDGHPAAVEEEAAAMVAIAQRHGAVEVKMAQSAEEATQMAAARRMAFPALARMRPTTLLEDITVPRSELARVVERIRRIAQENDLLIGTFGHAGDGNLHPTLLIDERDEDEVRRMRRAFDAIVEAAIEFGGSITGEHGVGLLKKEHLPRQAGIPALEVMMRFREAMDPNHVLNPGKMFTLRPRCEGRLPTRREELEKALEEASL